MPRKKKLQSEIKQIIEAGRRLGVDIDEEKALKWLVDMASTEGCDEDLLVDHETGIYGHKVSLIDFDATDLDRIKAIAEIVGVPDIEGKVETALSLSGSAAQSQVQKYPGDLDYFERVNIIAPTREEACKIAGEVIRNKALLTYCAPNYQLIEVKWGTFKESYKRKGELKKPGYFMSWTADEVRQGYMEVEDDRGNLVKLDWEYGEQDPGWCKFDWIIFEKDKGRTVCVSNMLDVTWENSKDGSIIPLDGQLDPYFQEVYIEASSIPLFTKLREYLTPDKLDNYISGLEGEVYKYCKSGNENYGKVAKRLYNIFRLTGRHKEAMFIRELFDEPAACLYQVWSLIETLDAGKKHAAGLDKRTLAEQAKKLIIDIVRICEGPEETEIVESLFKLRDDIIGFTTITDKEWDNLIDESRYTVVKLVNDYFYSRLKIMPQIIEYLENVKKKKSEGKSEEKTEEIAKSKKTEKTKTSKKKSKKRTKKKKKKKTQK
ncbi:MAG: hypothetical protein ACTSO9_14745 [Candidatus Helarchaeota archaeon]